MKSVIAFKRCATLLASATLLLAACSKKAEVAMPAANALEGQVDIVAWPGYVERGGSDKNNDWVTKFETDTGCKVNVKTAGTSDEMVSLMTQGGHDLVTASGDASLRLIRDGVGRCVAAPDSWRHGAGYRCWQGRFIQLSR